MKKLIQNKYVQFGIVFIAGCLVFRIFGPEKIEIKKEIEVKWAEKEVEKIVYQDRIIRVTEVGELVVSETKIVRKETFPDGHIIEEEIYESNTQQLQRIQSEEQEKYNEKLNALEREYNKKINESKTIINPKKVTVSFLVVGSASELDVHLGADVDYQIGSIFNMPIIGGLSYTNNGMIGGRLGFRF